MQPQNRRFFDSIEWENHVSDANGVSGEDRGVDEMLSILDTITEDRLGEYEDSLHYTSPSRERREARERAEYRIQQKEDHSPISGTH
jgi:hypothetical protein